MKYICLVSMLLVASIVSAQSVRSLVREGNDQYDDKKFEDSEVSYRKALEQEQGLVEGRFNLGNALYKQGKLEESVKEFEQAAVKSTDKQTQASAYYNRGNAHMQAKKYSEAVQSYVQSLKLNPNDQDTKYNLSYAIEKMKQQEQQQNQKNDKQDKKDQKKQDKNQQNQDQQQQQDQKQQQQNQDQQQQQQGQQEQRMSKADAQRMLDVLKNNEKNVQKKLRVKQATRAKTDRDW